MNIKPLPGWVLIEPIEDERVTASGLKLPDSTQDYPMKGSLLDVGLYKKNDPIPEICLETSVDIVGSQIKTGMNVYFKKFSGQDIKHEGKEYKLVEFKDLLAVIE